MTFNFKRSPDYFNKVFVNPSFILVCLSYLTFWINNKKAPERVIFITINILNALSLMVAMKNNIPHVPILTWIQNFLIWNLIFTIIPILEYSIQYGAMITYENIKNEIDKLMDELVAIASKIESP